MPLYAYTAIDRSGRTVRATIEADTEGLVLAKLRDQALVCTDIRRAKGGVKTVQIGRKKMKPKALVVFSRQFATMIDAGIPILRCLEILSGQCKDLALKEAVDAITSDVKSGLTLNEAMAKQEETNAPFSCPRAISRGTLAMARSDAVGSRNSQGS